MNEHLIDGGAVRKLWMRALKQLRPLVQGKV